MPPELPDRWSETVSRRLDRLGAQLGAQPDGGEPAWEEPEEVHTRIRPPDPPTRPGASVLPAPPALPVPGRHAARRTLDEEPRARLVPETLRGRVRVGAPQLAVVSVVVALGLLVTAWWTVRGRSTGELVPAAAVPALTAPASGGVPTAASTGPAPGSPTGSPSARVVVDVAGKVLRPGIVVLPVGSRVVDALRRAGGARPRVDLAGLNQARVLVDGEQIVVGRPAAPGVAASAASAAGSAGDAGGSGSALVSLNTADQAGLEALPGVGPVTAQAILAWRTDHGGFTSVDELLEVDGIGEKTLASLAPLVTL